MSELLDWAGALVRLALPLSVAGVLVWFAWHLVGRRVVRAVRIRHLRDRREAEEAARRE